jgi:Zn-dependent M16 (insulinase) family peptidase
MELIINQSYHGFRLLEERKIEEINSIGRLFVHEKTGAQLVHLENDDDNKVFSITFRTPPLDSTGLTHILEHSVLCGSRKFPTKEPFVELAKGSLNTFLNALTFPDKTMYPIASKNKKDFFNLMDVYLDAVFYPNVYKFPDILMQEGWHYEIAQKDAEIIYKGVVYNEMKGVFSSPESILFRKISESLFPDTPYSLESGGDPEVIPELTYANFIDFHKKYYHPSNSFIFLYGDGDLHEELQFLDHQYLTDFGRIDVNSQIPLQPPLEKQKEMVVEYPLSPEDDDKEKTFLSMNWVVGKAIDHEVYLAFDILEHLLLETPAAPLKKALLEAQLGKDVFGAFESSLLQPVFSVVVKNSEANRKDRFQEVVFETLQQLVKSGIDKKLIEASINIKEFGLREADYRGFPKGLYYCIQSKDSWLYGASPFAHLAYELPLNSVKLALTSDHFESLISQYLINNTHRSRLLVVPKKGLEEERAQRTREKLTAYKASLSEQELDLLVEETVRLKQRQTEPDSSEALATIPLLSLDDITHDAEKLPFEEKRYAHVPVLFHPMFTSHIGYVNLYFSTTSVPHALLPYLGLLTNVLGKVSTEKYPYEELSNEINIHTGGIYFNTESFALKENAMAYEPRVLVQSKAIIGKLSKLFELLGELTCCTRFDEKQRLKETLQEIKSRLEMSIFQNGHFVAANRVSSYFSPSGKFTELVSGFSFYKFIANLEKHFDEKFDQIRQNLWEVAKLVFNRNNLLVSYTAQESDYSAFEQLLMSLLDHLESAPVTPLCYDYDFASDNEGLLTPGKVQYVAKGYNFIRTGFKYSGTLQVLKTIISLDYLWNRVRVQGGAYGSSATFARNGNLFMTSYRDPNLKETLTVFDEVESYLREFQADRRQMTKYILGTISKIDAPLTPSMKGERATAHYLSGITYGDLQKERDEIISTTDRDISQAADLVGMTMRQNHYCVLGNETKIKEHKELFKKLIPVFE